MNVLLKTWAERQAYMEGYAAGFSDSASGQTPRVIVESEVFEAPGETTAIVQTLSLNHGTAKELTQVTARDRSEYRAVRVARAEELNRQRERYEAGDFTLNPLSAG